MLPRPVSSRAMGTRTGDLGPGGRAGHPPDGERPHSPVTAHSDRGFLLGTEALSFQGHLRPQALRGERGHRGHQMGILFLGHLVPSIPEHGRSQDLVRLDPCLSATWQGGDDRYPSLHGTWAWPGPGSNRWKRMRQVIKLEESAAPSQEAHRCASC